MSTAFVLWLTLQGVPRPVPESIGHFATRQECEQFVKDIARTVRKSSLVGMLLAHEGKIHKIVSYQCGPATPELLQSRNEESTDDRIVSAGHHLYGQAEPQTD